MRRLTIALCPRVAIGKPQAPCHERFCECCAERVWLLDEVAARWAGQFTVCCLFCWLITKGRDGLESMKLSDLSPHLEEHTVIDKRTVH